METEELCSSVLFSNLRFACCIKCTISVRAFLTFNDIYYLAMAYKGIEFADDSGGGVALISSQWLTPRKQEVFWPPYKSQSQYKALKKGVIPEQDGSWTIYKIKRLFFETDDYNKAQSKIKQAQITSDCQSEQDDILPLKRRIQKPKRLLNDSSDDYSSDEDEPLSGKHKFLPPPKITRVNEKSNETLSPSLSLFQTHSTNCYTQYIDSL